MFRRYKSLKFMPNTRLMIQRANEIITEYDRLGLRLTVRQIYYQFVSRGLISNNNREY